MICIIPTLPTTAVITTMLEIIDKNDILINSVLISMLLFDIQLQKDATWLPGVIVRPPKLVIMILIKSFCNSGESWIDVASVKIAADDPSQFPNLKILRSNPNPMTIKIKRRMSTKTYPLKMSMPKDSFLNCPARPYPIITPTSEMMIENPKNLFLESIGQVYVL